MNTPKAILIGFALVAAAVYFSRDVGPAQAALVGPGFQIINSGTGIAQYFKLNIDTGEVAFCVPDNRDARGLDGVKNLKFICSKFQ